MKGQKNPYLKDLKAQVTIRLDKETVEYFKGLAGKTGMSYQNLINLYLRECVETKKQPILQWANISQETIIHPDIPAVSLSRNPGGF